ncbi:family 43 glycosylhydrolase [Kitasatospora sp. NPDC057512]|uniref:family 43 glycosylhydrolase n=1 Tax=Kitasatospora sp. NPDC057512 TaxID=3346154 RepID=UPI0036A1346B
MYPISRRGLLRAAGAGALVLPLAGRTAPAASAAPTAAPTGAVGPRLWVGAGPFDHVYDPSTARRRYLNDHTLVQAGGRWHLFSIVGDSAPPGQAPDSAAEVSLAHASAPSPSGPWLSHPDALTVDASYFGEEHLWAPHVVESGGVHWMFYAAGGRAGAAVNAATSTDLSTWTRLPSGPLFRGTAARDPMVLRIGTEWVMYYTELSAPGGRHQVCYRRSADLLTWGEPGVAFADAATAADGVSVTESPFVVARDGWYYLLIGPRNGYEGTDVLASQDPFRFSLDGYAGHVPGHAVEVVTDGRQWWASAAGWFRRGLYLAPLDWRSTPPPWQSPDNPVAAPDVHGRLTVFALDAADWSMLRRVQTDPDTDTWSDWEVFGTPAGAVPVLGRNADGRLEVFSLAPDGAALHHRVQRTDGGWSDWEAFGGPAGAAPAVARDADDRLEVFALAPGGAALLHRWQTSPGGAWSAWEPFGTPAGAAPRVARDGTGRLNVTAIAPSGTAAFHRRQSVPSGGWDAWQPLLGWSTAAPSAIAGPDGRLEAFTLSPGGERLAHRWQSAPAGAWAPVDVLGEDFGEPGLVLAAPPSAAVDSTGRLHVFAVAEDGRVRTRVQDRPGGGWRPWAAFGDPPVAALRPGAPMRPATPLPPGAPLR